MKTITFVLTTLLASTAHAEISKLGDYTLGLEAKKPVGPKTATVLGCHGTIRPALEKGRVVGATLAADADCKAADVEAQLTKEYGAAPIVDHDKRVKLWEGKIGSVLLVTPPSEPPLIHLELPGAGAKRMCFSQDGFAAFWKTFKAAVDKPEAAVATFKFPVKDFDGKVISKDAKALAKQWPTLLDGADKKQLASGALIPTCAPDGYILRLSKSNLSLQAKQVGETWQWVRINPGAPG